jgi:hypothetical protein
MEKCSPLDFRSMVSRGHISGVRTITRSTNPVDPTDAASVLFGRQHGLAGTSQLRAAGVTARVERLQIERGAWQVYSPGVIRLRGAPDDWRQPPMATTLASARAAVTGPTGLRCHGLDGFAAEDGLYVVSHWGDRPRLPEGAHLWASRRLEAGDVMTLDGIRVTIAPTALVHAAPIVEAARFGKALDDLLRRDVSPAWVQSVADRWRGRGVPGSGTLTEALAERCDGRLPRSWFERMAKKSFRQHGIELRHEVPVFDGRKPIASLDLAHIERQVGVECQSWAWHATPTARRKDAARKRRLRRLGWDIVELWWSERDRMGDAIADVVEAMERQRVLLGR